MGSLGETPDEHKAVFDPDYREGWQRGRAAEVNRDLTGYAGYDNRHNLR